MEKFCPESCCVVGNYYSLKGRHESAVTYFQRAIKLNNKYVLVFLFCPRSAFLIQCFQSPTLPSFPLPATCLRGR